MKNHNIKTYLHTKKKSTTDALSYLTTKIERVLEGKERVLCTFRDIQGAFDNTTYEAIDRVSEGKCIDTVLLEGLSQCLKSL